MNQRLDFDRRPKLQTLIIGGNTKTVGSFDDCTSLKNVTINAPVKEFYGSFDGCSALTSITLPNTTETITTGAFRDTGLTSITFPASLKEIQMSAFSGTPLREIVFKGDAPTIQSNVFSGVTATAYYPADNPTWAESVLKDYGGTITWVAA